MIGLPRVWKADGHEVEGFVITPQEAENVKLAMDDFRQLLWASKQLLTDLPKKRDWLNPEIEKVLKQVTETYE